MIKGSNEYVAFKEPIKVRFFSLKEVQTHNAVAFTKMKSKRSLSQTLKQHPNVLLTVLIPIFIRNKGNSSSKKIIFDSEQKKVDAK